MSKLTSSISLRLQCHHLQLIKYHKNYVYNLEFFIYLFTDECEGYSLKKVFWLPDGTPYFKFDSYYIECQHGAKRKPITKVNLHYL